MTFDGKVKGALPGHYPMFDLKGADVVIVDEPLQNRDLVARLFAHIDPAKGPFTHRLLLLPVQQKRVLSFSKFRALRFGFTRSKVCGFNI